MIKAKADKRCAAAGRFPIPSSTQKRAHYRHSQTLLISSLFELPNELLKGGPFPLICPVSFNSNYAEKVSLPNDSQSARRHRAAQGEKAQ